jgi:RNA polymerase sigma-70 factor (ECF subfamily)
MLTTPELVWLLAAVAKGDRTAFERLYEATRAKLYGAALRILRRADLADEVVRDAYLQVWNSAAQFDPAVASPMTWMVAIARSRAIDLIRRQPELAPEEEPDTMPVPSEIADPSGRRAISEELRTLLACVGKLDQERRRLVLLAYYSGLSRDQLAARFETSAGTVKRRLRWALIDIRECPGT